MSIGLQVLLSSSDHFEAQFLAQCDKKFGSESEYIIRRYCELYSKAGHVMNHEDTGCPCDSLFIVRIALVSLEWRSIITMMYLFRSYAIDEESSMSMETLSREPIGENSHNVVYFLLFRRFRVDAMQLVTVW